jgi:hypothetical protein
MEHGRRDLSRLTVMILSGIAMLSEDALRCFYSPASAGRWALLAAAVLFYFTLRRRALLTLRTPSLWSRFAAVISLTLWLGVGIAGPRHRPPLTHNAQAHSATAPPSATPGSTAQFSCRVYPRLQPGAVTGELL